MAAARSLNPSFSVPSRHGVMDGPQHRGGPEDTGFLKRSVREEAASCGGEKTWGRGFRARTDGHRSCAKSREWFSGNTHFRRSDGCERFDCEVKLMAATRATCAPSALLQVIVVANSRGKFARQPDDRVLTQGIEIGAACSAKGETCG